jgi:hypothetical protein
LLDEHLRGVDALDLVVVSFEDSEIERLVRNENAYQKPSHHLFSHKKKNPVRGSVIRESI